MELVKGLPLTTYCDERRLSVPQRLELFVQVCSAVQHAHQKGIMHRDLKPSNILVTEYDGRPVPKVIDFGLAKALTTTSVLTEHTLHTAFGTMVGTPLYMAPEQVGINALDVDTRTDIYALGVLLYELLTGTTPLERKRMKEVAWDEMRRMIREDEPPRPSKRLSTMEQAELSTIAERRGQEPRRLSQRVRGELDWIVMKALEKDRNRRYESASAFAADVQRYLADEPVQACPPSKLYRLRKFAQRNKWRLAMASLLATAATLIVAAGVSVWKYQTTKEEFQQRVQGEQWVRQHAIPELRRLVGEKNYRDAFELAEQASRLAPDDPTLTELRAECSSTWSVHSDPPGATVQWRPYGLRDIEWKNPGATPLAVVLPRGPIHWKLTKNGFTTVEGWRGVQETVAHFPLYPSETVPVGMVRVAANQYRKDVGAKDPIEGVELPDYFIDRYEVTNQQFKAFVDAGGYKRKEFWKHPFLKGTAALPWEAAVKEFRDATGVPGPSAWSAGTYPPGEDDYPVRGLSWYEAAAYAEFAGKSLPTISHWFRAIGVGHADDIVAVSNFGQKGPAMVGSYPGVGPFGTHDMAGNVKEWCWNRHVEDLRFILGGAWDEPTYMFDERDAQSAWARSSSYGFRCVKYLPGPLPKAALADVPFAHRDYRKETPVSAEQLQIFKTMFVYEKGPLNAKVLSRKELQDHIHETIQFDAAYGTEKIVGHLFLPRRVRTPYQVVIYSPGAGAFREKVFPKDDPLSGIAPIVDSGRAVFWPVYKGTFERSPELRPGWSIYREEMGWSYYRELIIQFSKDFFRSIDYLEERPELDIRKLGYVAGSRGVRNGLPMLAMDERPKVAVFQNGGMIIRENPMPEIDGVNYVPAIKIPVLMINGRNDRDYEFEINQRPLFQMLGTPAADKRHCLTESGHAIPPEIVWTETLRWLDKYLGPVAWLPQSGCSTTEWRGQRRQAAAAGEAHRGPPLLSKQWRAKFAEDEKSPGLRKCLGTELDWYDQAVAWMDKNRS
jgi:formylglycine-generating enzyme required for sulfatase activity